MLGLSFSDLAKSMEEKNHMLEKRLQMREGSSCQWCMSGMRGVFSHLQHGDVQPPTHLRAEETWNFAQCPVPSTGHPHTPDACREAELATTVPRSMPNLKLRTTQSLLDAVQLLPMESTTLETPRSVVENL